MQNQYQHQHQHQHQSSYPEHQSADKACLLLQRLLHVSTIHQAEQQVKHLYGNESFVRQLMAIGSRQQARFQLRQIAFILMDNVIQQYNWIQGVLALQANCNTQQLCIKQKVFQLINQSIVGICFSCRNCRILRLAYKIVVNVSRKMQKQQLIKYITKINSEASNIIQSYQIQFPVQTDHNSNYNYNYNSNSGLTKYGIYLQICKQLLNHYGSTITETIKCIIIFKLVGYLVMKVMNIHLSVLKKRVDGFIQLSQHNKQMDSLIIANIQECLQILSYPFRPKLSLHCQQIIKDIVHQMLIVVLYLLQLQKQQFKSVRTQQICVKIVNAVYQMATCQNNTINQQIASHVVSSQYSQLILASLGKIIVYYGMKKTNKNIDGRQAKLIHLICQCLCTISSVHAEIKQLLVSNWASILSAVTPYFYSSRHCSYDQIIQEDQQQQECTNLNSDYRMRIVNLIIVLMDTITQQHIIKQIVQGLQSPDYVNIQLSLFIITQLPHIFHKHTQKIISIVSQILPVPQFNQNTEQPTGIQLQLRLTACNYLTQCILPELTKQQNEDTLHNIITNTIKYTSNAISFIINQTPTSQSWIQLTLSYLQQVNIILKCMHTHKNRKDNHLQYNNLLGMMMCMLDKLGHQQYPQSYGQFVGLLRQFVVHMPQVSHTHYLFIKWCIHNYIQHMAQQSNLHMANNNSTLNQQPQQQSLQQVYLSIVNIIINKQIQAHSQCNLTQSYKWSEQDIGICICIVNVLSQQHMLLKHIYAQHHLTICANILYLHSLTLPNIKFPIDTICTIMDASIEAINHNLNTNTNMSMDNKYQQWAFDGDQQLISSQSHTTIQQTDQALGRISDTILNAGISSLCNCLSIMHTHFPQSIKNTNTTIFININAMILSILSNNMQILSTHHISYLDRNNMMNMLGICIYYRMVDIAHIDIILTFCLDNINNNVSMHGQTLVHIICAIACTYPQTHLFQQNILAISNILHNKIQSQFQCHQTKASTIAHIPIPIVIHCYIIIITSMIASGTDACQMSVCDRLNWIRAWLTHYNSNATNDNNNNNNNDCSMGLSKEQHAHNDKWKINCMNVLQLYTMQYQQKQQQWYHSINQQINRLLIKCKSEAL